MHVHVLDKHAIDDCNGLKVDGELLELGLVALDIINLRLECNIVVTLVSGTLSLEATNILFDVSLDLFKLILGLLLRALDFTCDFVMKLLIFLSHVVFDLANLLLNDNCGLLNLIVSDLTT